MTLSAHVGFLSILELKWTPIWQDLCTFLPPVLKTLLKITLALGIAAFMPNY
jgi:hypothetical protein